MAGGFVKQINDGSFDSTVLEAKVPVLVDFWAPWCGPCRALAPTIDEIAEEHSGRVLVCKVNVDESPDVAARYGIRSIPTIILFKDGKVANQVMGNVPKSSITAMIG